MPKYTTVEGHPIVRDGEYEMASGDKAIVVGFNHEESRIWGYSKITPIMFWDSDGTNYGTDYATYADLMRPWKDKPDAKKECSCENPTHHTKRLPGGFLHAYCAACGLVRRGLVPQLAQEDKPDAEGWIKWEGGECPVKIGVEIKFRDGDTRFAWSESYNWKHHHHHMISGREIVAYRIVKEPSPEVKIYKLSEMWKVWQRQRDVIRTHYTETYQEAKDYADPLAHPIAITPADATEFYEGEGLEEE